MAAPGGYAAIPGMYRVPDLLTEEQFKDYMWNTYRRKVEFTDTENYVNPARALGRSAPIGVPDEREDVPGPRDYHLKAINEMDWSTPNEVSVGGKMVDTQEAAGTVDVDVHPPRTTPTNKVENKTETRAENKTTKTSK